MLEANNDETTLIAMTDASASVKSRFWCVHDFQKTLTCRIRRVPPVRDGSLHKIYKNCEGASPMRSCQLHRKLFPLCHTSDLDSPIFQS